MKQTQNTVNCPHPHLKRFSEYHPDLPASKPDNTQSPQKPMTSKRGNGTKAKPQANPKHISSEQCQRMHLLRCQIWPKRSVSGHDRREPRKGLTSQRGWHQQPIFQLG